MEALNSMTGWKVFLMDVFLKARLNLSLNFWTQEKRPLILQVCQRMCMCQVRF